MSCYDPCCCNPCMMCSPCSCSPDPCSCNCCYNSCCNSCTNSNTTSSSPSFVCANGTLNDYARCALARYDQISCDLDSIPAAPCCNPCGWPWTWPCGWSGCCLPGCNCPTTLPIFPRTGSSASTSSTSCANCAGLGSGVGNCSSCAPSYLNAVNEAEQSVTTNNPINFATDRVANGTCVQHTAGTSNFTLTCPGVYLVEYNANVEPDSGSNVAISMALLSGGAVVPGSESAATGDANQLNSVSASTLITVPCGTTGTIALSNTSAGTVKVTNANILITRIL